jgi:hypothetical protein
LTCHGALIVLPKCSNPASCPCTHVNCGGNGQDVYDHIAGDWSPTIGVDVTLNVDINFSGGHISISDTTSVSYSNGQSANEGQGSSNSVVVSSDGSSNSDSSSVSDLSSSSSSSSHDNCCKCGCKHSSKRKARKHKRGLKARDDGTSVSTPPYAFDTSCSKSPIPYDEERIIILEDAYYDQDSTLAATALYGVSSKSVNFRGGRFIGGANNLLLNGKQFSVCNQTIVDALGYGETCGSDCSFANVQIEPGKTYLFRIV